MSFNSILKILLLLNSTTIAINRLLSSSFLYSHGLNYLKAGLVSRANIIFSILLVNTIFINLKYSYTYIRKIRSFFLFLLYLSSALILKFFTIAKLVVITSTSNIILLLLLIFLLYIYELTYNSYLIVNIFLFFYIFK
jgi:hypothetical protein